MEERKRCPIQTISGSYGAFAGVACSVLVQRLADCAKHEELQLLLGLFSLRLELSFLLLRQYPAQHLANEGLGQLLSELH